MTIFTKQRTTIYKFCKKKGLKVPFKTINRILFAKAKDKLFQSLGVKKENTLSP